MIEEDPRIDPAGLRDVRFPGSFRRYDAKAVDDFLGSIADRIAATNTLIDDLRGELERARHEASDAPREPSSPFDAPDLSTLSEDELVNLVGEETAHVLSTARKAASDIRTKAEESAARLIREATADAAELTAAAEATAAELTDEATTARDTAVAAAEAEAEEIRAAAVTEAEELMAAGRAEAEALEASIEQRRREAEEEAEQTVEEAKDEGRAMVAEAKKVRSRILEDLQRRRDLGRSQVERLAAGRDQLLDAYAAVRENLDEITGRLEDGLLEMGAGSHDPLLDDGFAGIVISGMDDVETEDDTDVDDEHVEPAEADVPEVGKLDAEKPEVEEPEVEEPVDETPADGGPDVDGGPDDEGESDVDALFAKIRAERAESVARAQKVLAGDEAPEEAVPIEAEAPDPEETPGAEAPETDGGGDQVPAALLADAASLEHRSEIIGPLDKDLARALKRHLADEQNVVLDALRRTESTDPEELFPPLDAHVAGYAEVAAVQLAAAAGAGAALVGGDGDVDVTSLAHELGSSLIQSFRRRIDRSAADVDGDADALDERLRALYREWKVEHIGAATTDALLSAYALGQYTAADEGAALRWLIDPEQGPCPDAQDNALAGAMRKGEPFPTGDECPQAHPGCRCLLVIEP